MASLSARMVEAADGGDGDLLSWVARYGDEGSCEEALMRLRFPGGWAFPRCGNRRCSPVAGRPRKRQCTRCRLQFSVTSGTPMQGSRLPLPTWFLAFRLVAGSKRGVSDARRECRASPLVALGYHLVQQPCPVHVEGDVAELVQD